MGSDFSSSHVASFPSPSDFNRAVQKISTAASVSGKFLGLPSSSSRLPVSPARISLAACALLLLPSHRHLPSVVRTSMALEGAGVDDRRAATFTAARTSSSGAPRRLYAQVDTVQITASSRAPRCRTAFGGAVVYGGSRWPRCASDQMHRPRCDSDSYR